MKKINGALLAAVLGSAIAVGGTLGPAQAGTSSDMRLAQYVQFNIFGGRHYCWYDDAWQGPGWYWCGYAWRNGYGWGGGYGWHNWRGGHAGGYGRGGYGRGGYGRGGYGHGGYGHGGGHGGYAHGGGHSGGHGGHPGGHGHH